MNASDEKPADVGPYKRVWNDCTRYSFWNGNYWGVLVHTVERAIEYRDTPSGEQDLPWCAI